MRDTRQPAYAHWGDEIQSTQHVLQVLPAPPGTRVLYRDSDGRPLWVPCYFLALVCDREFARQPLTGDRLLPMCSGPNYPVIDRELAPETGHVAIVFPGDNEAQALELLQQDTAA